MRLLHSMLAVGMLASVPATATAAVYTPTPADLNDLNYYQTSLWKVDVNDVKRQRVTRARITSEEVDNWNSGSDRLFLRLFNNTAPSTNSSFGYSWTDSDDTGIAAAFSSPPSWLVGNLQGDLKLTDRAFADLGKAPGTTAGVPTTQSGTAGSDRQLNTQADNNGRPNYNYTYTFTTGQSDEPNSYIDDGWVALAFDSDSHFFNDGLTLDLSTSPNIPVPEPASLLLIGTGLALASRVRRKITAANKDKS